MKSVRWVVIDGIVKKNPSKEEIETAKEVTYIYGGQEDIVIQTWWVDYEHTKCIDFAYHINMIESLNPRIFPSFNPKYDIRKEHFERFGIKNTPQHLKSVIIPQSQITDDGIISLGGWRNLSSYLY